MSVFLAQQRGAAVRFHVRVQPRASATEIAGVYDGALRVRVQAPPVGGAANEALIAFLARSLGVARRNVRVVAGAAARTKTVEVEGVGHAAVERLAKSL